MPGAVSVWSKKTVHRRDVERFFLFPGGRRSRHRRRAGRRKLPDQRSRLRPGQYSRGPAICRGSAPLGGRLGILCQRVYQRADHPGYLEMGVPAHYGAGAAEVMRELCENGATASRLTNESLSVGDIERALMEWRSLLRHIVAAPDFEWDRWRELKSAATHYVENTKSPTVLEFPPLLASQQRRLRGTGLTNGRADANASTTRLSHAGGMGAARGDLAFVAAPRRDQLSRCVRSRPAGVARDGRSAAAIGAGLHQRVQRRARSGSARSS